MPLKWFPQASTLKIRSPKENSLECCSKPTTTHNMVFQGKGTTQSMGSLKNQTFLASKLACFRLTFGSHPGLFRPLETSPKGNSSGRPSASTWSQPQSAEMHRMDLIQPAKSTCEASHSQPPHVTSRACFGRRHHHTKDAASAPVAGSPGLGGRGWLTAVYANRRGISHIRARRMGEMGQLAVRAPQHCEVVL